MVLVKGSSEKFAIGVLRSYVFLISLFDCYCIKSYEFFNFLYKYVVYRNILYVCACVIRSMYIKLS